MRRWTKQIRALELFGEKNRLGRGSNLGQVGGKFVPLGPRTIFLDRPKRPIHLPIIRKSPKKLLFYSFFC